LITSRRIRDVNNQGIPTNYSLNSSGLTSSNFPTLATEKI
jgi:hypothetical protein